MDLDILGFTEVGLRFIMIATLVYIALLFFLKIKRARGKGVELSPFLGLALLFLLFGICQIFFAYHYYYELEGISSFELYKTAVLLGYGMLISLVFVAERILKKTYYAFTLFSIGACIYGALFLYTEPALRRLTYITMPISMLIVLISYTYIFVVKTEGSLRRKMASAVIALTAFFMFYAVTTDRAREVLPFPEEGTLILGESGIILSLAIFAFIFLGFETITEFGWKEKLRELFIISSGGVTLYHHSFEAAPESADTDLISSGLTGVRGILAEMIKSTATLKVVDHEDVKLIFEYGPHCTLALIVYENLRIYHSKLLALRTRFERVFDEVLADWNGEVGVFLPTKQLIADLFV
jgi:hypothetical protein